MSRKDDKYLMLGATWRCKPACFCSLSSVMVCYRYDKTLVPTTRNASIVIDSFVCVLVPHAALLCYNVFRLKCSIERPSVASLRDRLAKQGPD